MGNLEIKTELQHFSGMPTAIIRLQGMLDSYSKPELEQTIENLLSENVSCFIFDFLELKMAHDSGYLGFFIGVAAEAKERNGRVVVINPSDRIKTTFEIIGLWKYIDLANDFESALRLFLPPST